MYTTKKYNLYYDDAVFAEKHEMSQDYFERHETFDMHAFGVILQQIVSSSEYASELGTFLLMNLNWLSSKCCLHNPDQRMSPDDAYNFCSLLAKFWSLRFHDGLK